MTTTTTPEKTTYTRGGSALRINSVTKSFGDTQVLKGIDIDVKEGEFLTLLGPSGSGKTTLLRITAGFESLTTGQIIMDGTDLAMLPPSDRELGMVFQQYALFPHLSVADNIAYGLKQRKHPREKIEARVTEMLQMIDMEHAANRRPGSLSGGQQQRVALARALAYGPRLLLMDEPLGALDRSLRLQLEQEIRKVHREVGTTIIYVTHDQEEALVLSDRVAILEDGHLAGLDTASNLYHHPPNRFVARFFSDSNIFTGTAGDHQVTLYDQTVRAATDFTGTVYAAVRPSKIQLNPKTGFTGWALPATVIETTLLGELRQIELDVEGVGKVIAKEDIDSSPGYAAGTEITIGFSAADATFMNN